MPLRSAAPWQSQPPVAVSPFSGAQAQAGGFGWCKCFTSGSVVANFMVRLAWIHLFFTRCY